MEVIGNNFIPIELSEASIKYLKINHYGEFSSGKYPNFEPNQPIEQKYSKNDLNIAQYNDMEKRLAVVVDDANQYVSLSQNIKSEVIEKIKTFAYIL